MHKKKFKWTKKNIIAISVTSFIVLSASIWGIFSFLDKEEEIKPVSQEEQPEKISMGKKEVETANYENLLGLDYILLRAEKIEDETKDNVLFMDIQVEKPLDKEQLLSLGQEAYKVLSKAIGKEGSISSVSLNVFTNKEGFEQTKEPTYAGGYVEGLIQSFSSTHLNGNKALLKTYDTFQTNTDVENMDASLDFDIVNATIQEQEKTITADVVMSAGTKDQVEDMLESIVAMLKEKNEAVHVNLRVYDTEKNYEDGQLNYEYSTLNPTLLLSQSQVTY